jgi:hypothetical protein
VIGSQDAAATPSQHGVCEQQSAGTPFPSITWRAASPYFSLTISFTSIGFSLLADLDDGLGLNRFVSGAAFGIKEAQQFLQRLGIGRIPEESALPAAGANNKQAAVNKLETLSSASANYSGLALNGYHCQLYGGHVSSNHSAPGLLYLNFRASPG